MKNIFAHTDAGCDYPAYISINRDGADGSHRISVRSAGNGGSNIGEILVSPETLEHMAAAVLAAIGGNQPADGLSHDELCKVMVDRFLGWKLPDDFAPDAGISLNRTYVGNFGMPTGTNLLHAGQALEMFKHCLPADLVAPSRAALIAAAVDRISATIIVEGETPEKLRERIAGRVADIAKPTFEMGDAVATWQDRVVAEKAELDGRLMKLRAFIASPDFWRMPTEDAALLLDQEKAMAEYSAVLGKRIDRFSGQASIGCSD